MEEASLEKGFLNRCNFRGRVEIFVWSRTKIFFKDWNVLHRQSNNDNDSFILITQDKTCTFQLIILKIFQFFLLFELEFSNKKNYQS